MEKVKGLLHDSIKKILRQQAKGTHGIRYRRYETSARETGGIYRNWYKEEVFRLFLILYFNIFLYVIAYLGEESLHATGILMVDDIDQLGKLLTNLTQLS